MPICVGEGILGVQDHLALGPSPATAMDGYQVMRWWNLLPAPLSHLP